MIEDDDLWLIGDEASKQTKALLIALLDAKGWVSFGRIGGNASVFRKTPARDCAINKAIERVNDSISDSNAVIEVKDRHLKLQILFFDKDDK